MTTSAAPDPALPERIVFFDGVCGLCDRTVRMLIARDRHRRLRYAPLQGETARERLATTAGQDFSSIVYLERGARFEQSDAVWRILRALGGFWGVCGLLLRIVPRPIRDFLYRVVAKRRYAWFGRHDACRLPVPGERELFLP
jgi:predicted DCC family thiol-disulfide oxidoreductase YuxK